MTNTNQIPHDVLAWYHAACRQQRSTLNQLRQIGEWARHTSHFVHALQCERGVSNLWLCSDGKRYQQERKLCIHQSDEQQKVFAKMLESAAPPFSSLLCTSLACALWYLDTLSALRERIAARDIEPTEAMTHFSQVIRHLLNIVVQTNDAIDNPAIARMLTALYSVMQGKELAGQERALGAMGFTRGDFDDALRQQLVDRIDGQQHCFDSFLLLTTGYDNALFNDTCTPGREIEQLRRLACTRLPAGEDNARLAQRWFSLQTERLDNLRSLEERLIAGLINEIDGLLNEESDETSFGRWLETHADAVSMPPGRTLLPLVRDQAQQIDTLSRQLASLQASIEERKIIDKAKNLLMAHFEISEEQAWQRLRKQAMNRNMRMVDIASAMLAVGALLKSTPEV